MSIIDEYVECLKDLCNDFDKESTNTDQLIEEADEIIEQIKIELSAIPRGPRRNEIENTIKNYKDKLLKQKKINLLGSDENRVDNRSKTQIEHDSLLALEEARKQLMESEEVAHETLGELERQTEVMKNTNRNINATNEELGYSNKLLTRMGKWWRG